MFRREISGGRAVVQRGIDPGPLPCIQGPRDAKTQPLGQRLGKPQNGIKNTEHPDKRIDLGPLGLGRGGKQALDRLGRSVEDPQIRRAGRDLRALRSRIENILVASIGFSPDADTLTLSQFPFARGVGASLTPFEIAELTGLGLLSFVLLGVMFAPAPVAAPGSPTPARERPIEPARHSRPAPQVLEPNQDLDNAATLAETHPSQTANLVRDWMSYREE